MFVKIFYFAHGKYFEGIFFKWFFEFFRDATKFH